MKKIVFTLLVLLMVTGVSAIMVKVYPYEMKTGLNDVRVIVLNHGDTIKDARISMNIPDLDIRSQTESIKLNSNKAARTYFEVNVDEKIKPDCYPIRIAIADKTGNIRNTHTWGCVN